MSAPATTARLAAWWRSPRPASAYLAPLALMAAITWSSSIPGYVGPESSLLSEVLEWVPPAWQNLVHVPVFGLLAVLLERAIATAPAPRPLAAAALAFALTCAFGLADEWHQAFVPGRYSTATDALLDVLGATLAVILVYRLRARGGPDGHRRAQRSRR